MSEFPNVYTLERTAFTDEQRQVVASLMSKIDDHPVHRGGVTLYRVPLNQLERYRQIGPSMLDERISAIRLAALIAAASGYLAQGEPLDQLNPLRAEECGLLPTRWIDGLYLVGRSRYLPVQDGLILGRTEGDNVAVGLYGSEESLRRLALEYSSYAEVPHPFKGTVRYGNASLFSPNQRTENWAEAIEWVLLLEFRRNGLEEALSHARKSGLLPSDISSAVPQLSCPPLPDNGKMDGSHKISNPR
jgi:hypothetical protein